MHSLPPNLPSIITTLGPVIHHYGYAAIGLFVLLENFGIPVPGETILIASAIYAGAGELNIFLAALVAFAAAILGDNIGFAIGEFGGRRLLDKYGRYVWLTSKKLDKAEAFFNRNGAKVVVIARFVEGLRQFNGLIAGISEMKWSKFLTFNTIGAALWVGSWTTIGYFAGSHISNFRRYELYITILAAVVLAALIFKKIYKVTKNRRIV
jgi:membrane protein DedA with SNARE-associated domain